MVVFCSKCGKEFHNGRNLNQHMNSVHSKNEDEEMDSDNESYSDDASEIEEEEDEWIIDIWDMIKRKAESTNSNLKKVYKDYDLLVKSFKHDKIHQKVMVTVKGHKMRTRWTSLRLWNMQLAKERF